MARCAVGALAAALDEDPLVLLKGGPIELSDFFIFNNDITVGFVQFFDAGAIGSVTLGVTSPDFIVGVAAGSFAQGYLARPRMFHNGIVVGFTTTPTGSGATGSTAVVNVGISKG